MSIEKVFRKGFMQFSSPEKLKHGHIILGQIQKIFHNNRAQIKMGNRSMIAQIEAPLVVGKTYYFQVGVSSRQIRLKVITEKPQHILPENIHKLLDFLKLPKNQTNIDFIRFVTEHKLPIDKIQLPKAIEILKETKNKTLAQNVIAYLLLRDLPISKGTFKAIDLAQTKQLSEQLEAVLSQLQEENNQTFIKQQLMNRIRLLLGQPVDPQDLFISQVMNEVLNDNEQLYRILKSLKLIDPVPFSRWKSEWILFVKESLLSAHSTVQEFPFHVNIHVLLQLFSHLKTHQSKLFQVSQMLLEKHNQLSKIGDYLNVISDEQFLSLKKDLTDHVIPLLPRQMAEDLMGKGEYSQDILRHISSVLQILSSEQTYKTIHQTLLQTIQHQPSIKEEFLVHLSRVLHLTGLTDESMIAANKSLHPTIPSLKSMLIQFIRQDNYHNDQAQFLLHLINGLQIQSVYEANGFMYAMLQIPGGKFNLPKDIEIEFSSRKNKDGMIDPDFCRMIFDLDLNHLHETVIDLQIQNRLVSMVIFNDEDKCKNLFSLFQPSLKAALKSHNYCLTSIKVKPLKQIETENDLNFRKLKEKTLEGIDFRV